MKMKFAIPYKTLGLFLLLSFPVFIKAQYRYLVPYNENGKYGYCDTNAVVKIKPQFANAYLFTLDYAFVDVGGGQLNIIDTTGKILLPQSFLKLYFIDHSYYSAIVIGEDNEGRGYVYDLQNQKLLNQGTDALFGTKDLHVQNNRYFTIAGDVVTSRGIYDAVSKKIIYKTGSRYLKLEADKKVATKVKDRSYFIVREANSTDFGAPEKVRYVYLQNGAITFYNKPSGKQQTSEPEMVEEIVSMPNTGVESNTSKIALYKAGIQTGIVVNEITNNIIVKRDSLRLVFDSIIFPSGTTFPCNCCFVKLNNQWGIWDWKLNLLSAVIYDTIKYNTACSYFISFKNKKSGLLYNTRELLRPEYDKITALNDGGYSLQQNNKYGYFNKDFYSEAALSDKSLLMPCIYDVSFAASITIYPVNGKIKKDPAYDYPSGITGTTYRVLLQSSPGYSYVYKRKYISSAGIKFYK
jgi:WG containing repeat